MTRRADNQRMIDVYASIYARHYARHSASLDASRRSIREDLALIGIPARKLPHLTVLNVGTGREALILHELGFGHVEHVDLSPLAVASVASLRESSEAYSSINTAQLDICADPLPIDRPLDLVYLNGVLHHLHNPAAAIDHILACAHADTILFFRVYRSGSLLFFVVDFIRAFVRYDDRVEFHALAETRPWVRSSQWLASDMWDDFFVPVLRLYPVRCLHDYFGQRGWRPRVKVPLAAYDHTDPTGASDSVALVYEASGASRMRRPQFPATTDQRRDIAFTDRTIQLTVEMMLAVLPALLETSRRKRLGVAMDLYWAARQPTGGTPSSRHRRLRAILQRFSVKEMEPS
jgi:SAM-dependent methyltransferase